MEATEQNTFILYTYWNSFLESIGFKYTITPSTRQKWHSYKYDKFLISFLISDNNPTYMIFTIENDIEKNNKKFMELWVKHQTSMKIKKINSIDIKLIEWDTEETKLFFTALAKPEYMPLCIGLEWCQDVVADVLQTCEPAN